MKRQQKSISPAQALAETVGREKTSEETNVVLKEENKKTKKGEKKVERKRVSFDIRTDLHKKLKMQALVQEKNIYILIEEALEKYLKDNKE
jgi:hypothetical protein